MSSNTSMVSSAASCGKPQPIRSVGNTHSSHREQESFMFTKGLSSSRGFSLAAAALAAAALAGLAAGAGTAQAGAMYGVQFLSSESSTVYGPAGTPAYNGTALTPTQVAGVVPQDNFNVVTSESTGGATGPAVAGGPVTLVDGTGSNSAGVQFSWVDYGNYYTSTADNATPSGYGNNGALLSAQSQSGYGSTTTGGNMPGTYKFSNLAAGNYDLIAYTVNNSQTASGGYVGIVSAAVNGTSTGNTYYDQNQYQGAWVANQTFVQATSTTLAGATTMANYVEFAGLNVPSAGGYITLSNFPSAGTTSSAVVNALQLVAVPEPATLGLFAVGGIALLLLGRKRAVCKRS